MSNASPTSQVADFRVQNRRSDLRYWICWVVVWLFFRLFFRVRIVGQEHIPRKGPLVIASNHISLLDPPLLGLCTPRFVHFMAKEELFRNRFIAKLLRYLGGFPVRRGAGDRQAIRIAIAIPSQGGCLAIFPEGHRYRDGKLGPGLPGVALIARKAGCPIVPAAIIGKYRLFARLTVRFGEPYVPDFAEDNDALVADLMRRIQALLDRGHA
jgi:1-acyl-sn-glycerol-3-phosphate acyltransferase